MTAKNVTSTRYQQAPAQAEFAAAVSRALRGADRVRWAIWRWYQVHTTTRRLAGLQDHILRDIGLSRASIETATLRRVREEEALRRFGSW
jgi:uncharacterized protein YjiS (DUF1127 family)